MKTHSTILLLVAIVLTFIARIVHGQGTIIAQHSGFTNPTNEGFGLYTHYASPPVGGIANDMGYSAWITPNWDWGIMYSNKIGNISSANWTLSVTVRVLPTETVPEIFFANVDTGSSQYGLGFGSDINGDQIVSIGSTNFTLYGSSTYNNYQLVYSSGTQTASLWIDGTEELSGIAAQPGSSPATLEWGESAFQALNQQANWNLVSLMVTPEPSAWSLILLGGGILIYVRRVFRRERV
jgi:hypothetical protein